MLKSIHACINDDDAAGRMHHINPDTINVIMLFESPNEDGHTASFMHAGHLAFTNRENILSIIRTPDFIQCKDGYEQKDGTINTILIRTSAIIQVSEYSAKDRERRTLRNARIGVQGIMFKDLDMSDDGGILALLTGGRPVMTPCVWLGVQETVSTVLDAITKQG